jgi:hypothetical protein
MELLKVLYLINIELMKDIKGVVMKKKYFIGIVSCIILCTSLIAPCFPQSAADCTVTQKTGNLIIISCPDGSRTVNAEGRADLYRVGDRVDIYGLPSNQPNARPGETPLLKR